jgi:hypothetical protein
MFYNCPIEIVEGISFPDNINIGTNFMMESRLDYDSFLKVFNELARIKAAPAFVGVTPATATKIIENLSTGYISDTRYNVNYNPNNLSEGHLTIQINQ